MLAARVSSDLARITDAAEIQRILRREIANALGDDPNFAATITALINARAKTYSQDVGDNSATAIVVTHNLNTRDVQVSLRQTGAPYSEVMIENEATTVNTVTLRFGTAPTLAQYRVTIQGR